jgi:hypothetical protein
MSHYLLLAINDAIDELFHGMFEWGCVHGAGP